MKNRLRVLRAEREWSQATLARQLEVSRQKGHNNISILEFSLPKDEIKRAVLQFNAKAESSFDYDDGFIFRLYKIDPNKRMEDVLCKDVSALKNIDLKNYPIGHVTCFKDLRKLSVEASEAINESIRLKQERIKFVLIRELYWPDESTDHIKAFVELGNELAPQIRLVFE